MEQVRTPLMKFHNCMELDSDSRSSKQEPQVLQLLLDSTINNVLYEHLESYIAKLEEMGVRMTISEDSISVEKQTGLEGHPDQNLSLSWFCD